MTPKEKAKELFQKYIQSRMHIRTKIDSIPTVISDYPTYHTAKSCALICVDEILDGFRKLLPSSRAYWEEVRKEIENI